MPEYYALSSGNMVYKRLQNHSLLIAHAKNKRVWQISFQVGNFAHLAEPLSCLSETVLQLENLDLQDAMLVHCN